MSKKDLPSTISPVSPLTDGSAERNMAVSSRRRCSDSSLLAAAASLELLKYDRMLRSPNGNTPPVRIMCSPENCFSRSCLRSLAEELSCAGRQFWKLVNGVNPTGDRGSNKVVCFGSWSAVEDAYDSPIRVGTH